MLERTAKVSADVFGVTSCRSRPAIFAEVSASLSQADMPITGRSCITTATFSVTRSTPGLKVRSFGISDRLLARLLGGANPVRRPDLAAQPLDQGVRVLLGQLARAV